MQGSVCPGRHTVGRSPEKDNLPCLIDRACLASWIQDNYARIMRACVRARQPHGGKAEESGKGKRLPVSPPLRTVRASFPAYGSSFNKTLISQCPALKICCENDFCLFSLFKVLAVLRSKRVFTALYLDKVTSLVISRFYQSDYRSVLFLGLESPI